MSKVSVLKAIQLQYKASKLVIFVTADGGRLVKPSALVPSANLAGHMTLLSWAVAAPIVSPHPVHAAKILLFYMCSLFIDADSLGRQLHDVVHKVFMG